MCGIVSVLTFEKEIIECLISSLERLEYRGYDSAGIAYIDENSKIERIRRVGKVAHLRQAVEKLNTNSHIGIGHTRWATHGKAIEKNAHPHIAGGVAIVHNGIIENFEQIKRELLNEGEVFESDSDSEVIAKLISYHIKTGLSFTEAMKTSMPRLKGTYAIAAIYEKQPNVLIGTKKGSPMAVGLSSDGRSIFIASDSVALSSLAGQITYLEDGDFVICLKEEEITYKILDSSFSEVNRSLILNNIAQNTVTKSGFADFMLKEIFEEPNTALETFNNFGSPIDLSQYKNISLIACGTSYYAGVLAKYWIEDLVGIHTDVEIASEFRYRNPVLSKSTLYIFISQSGETIDTLNALRNVKAQGLDTLSIVNVESSSIDREAKYKIKTSAGPEIGVASTKSFIAQALSLLLLFVDKNKIDIKEITHAMNEVISQYEKIKNVANKIKNSKSLLYIGRGTSYPIALEGALKAKELSYISAEGYPSGEIKHGPMALVDESIYSIILAPQDKYFEKTISNAQEILARNGRVLFITNEGVQLNFGQASYLYVPKIDPTAQPFVLTTAIHLLAYYIAKQKGLNVDQPRNLAKSVTVE
ncbi:MAG: glutamine--fructose-6-phosphate transaminase (isomerizing) [Holosporales bacterium]|jgi:glucosamine--fructose-6-phosphate aminotransferase (isomerizing)|nr:glutamine--fructose-6-phosphate transaminase (isomerizing) [Holosporales bacterium]